MKLSFYTVIMNLPFGAQDQAGIDLMSFKKLQPLLRRVYSMHKSSTEASWLRKAKEWHMAVKQIQFNISKFRAQRS